MKPNRATVIGRSRSWSSTTIRDLRRYVRRSLKRPGHPATQVLEAGDAPRALEIVAGTPLHLVITDVVMPGMDGLSLVREIRRSHSSAQLPVLVMTGERSRREAASEASHAGAQDVLTKPFNARKLCDAVTRLLQEAANPTRGPDQGRSDEPTHSKEEV